MSFSLKKELFTFTKAQTSAIFATACDYAMRLLIDKVVGLNYLLATALGALTGALVNCIVNYNFTFRGNAARKRDVALRYAFTWTGSITLNTLGTAFFHEVLGVKAYLAMLITSLLVALLWNYSLQRSFVYQTIKLNTFFMKIRSSLQQFIYRVIDPLIRPLIRLGVTPNLVTFLGFLGTTCSSAIFFLAALHPSHSLSLLGWGGLVMICSGLFDMIDGRLARLANLTSRFGAFWDSTLDRYSELFTLAAVATFFFSLSSILWGAVSLLALVGSIMVSYVRARAEAVGLECKVGILQRPERVVLLSLGTIITGLTSHLLPTYIAVATIALLANYTAIRRILHVYKNLH